MILAKVEQALAILWHNFQGSNFHCFVHVVDQLKHRVKL